MKFDFATLFSLAMAVGCVVGGLWLVPALAGSDATPWPQVGVAAGWVAYLIGRSVVKTRMAPPPG